MRDKLGYKLTRPQTRQRQGQMGQAGRQAQRGGHSIPDQMGDKLEDKTADKGKSRPRRSTQHPDKSKTAQGGGHSMPDQMRPDGRQQDRSQEKGKTSEADTASKIRPETRERQDQRGGHSTPAKADTPRKHWEPQQ